MPEHGTMSESGYVEYLPGNIPLIISVPHDGEKSPSFIPDREGGDIHTKSDANTQELGFALRKAFFALTGKTPYVVVNHMRRRKVDVNREIEEAAEGNKTAETVWDEYHSFIDSAKESVFMQYKKGLYIDLHAHGHAAQFLELGYLLDEEELQLEDKDLDDSMFIEKSSIKHMVSTDPRKESFIELLRGPHSLGALLETAGYPAIPSPKHPAPDGKPFFRGGYSLYRHGSLNGGTIDGIQMETCSKNVRDSSGNIETFSEAFVDIMIQYINYHYNIQIGKTPLQNEKSAE